AGPARGGGAGERRVEEPGRAVGEVEVERVRPVFLGVDVEVATRAVGLRPTRRVEEWHEERVIVACVKRVSGQRSTLATEVEREDSCSMRRPQPAIRRRNLEIRGLVAGVWLERSPLEPEGLIDRVIRQSAE